MPKFEELEREIKSLRAQVDAIRRPPTYLQHDHVSEEPPSRDFAYIWDGDSLKFRPGPVGGPGLTVKAGNKVVTAPGWWAIGIAPIAVIAGTIYWQPIFVQRRTSFTGFGVNVQIAAAAGSLGRCALYTEVNGTPNTLIVDGGTFSTASTGNKVLTIAQTLHGWYWACVVCDNTPSLGGVDTTSPCGAPVSGRINSYSTNVFGVIGTTSGKSAYVAAGFPVTADALGNYITIDAAFMKFTE